MLTGSIIRAMIAIFKRVFLLFIQGFYSLSFKSINFGAAINLHCGIRTVRFNPQKLKYRHCTLYWSSSVCLSSLGSSSWLTRDFPAQVLYQYLIYPIISMCPDNYAALQNYISLSLLCCVTSTITKFLIVQTSPKSLT